MTAALLHLETRRRHAIGNRLSIGRAPDSDVRLDDPLVSRHHAEIAQLADGSFVIRDLGSRRGTYVGATKVDEAPLRDGDELLIGPARFAFEATAPASNHSELAALRAVAALGRAIAAEHDLDALLARVLATCFELLAADRGMVIVYAPGTKVPATTVARDRAGTPLPGALSTSVLSQILAMREPYLRTEIAADVTLQRSESLSANDVRSVLAVPLFDQDGEWLGVLQLDTSAGSALFKAHDLELARTIADQAALAIKNVMLVRQLRDQRSEARSRLDQLVAGLALGIVVLDGDRRCILANEWITSRGSLVGEVAIGAVLPALAGIAGERLAEPGLRELVTIGDPPVALAVRTVGGDGESIVFVEDVTAHRAAQANAAHLERLALIGQLAGGVAHDFNNLLFVILNYAQLLEETIADVDQREDAHAIAQAGRSATELTRQLLAYSRREVVKPRVVDVAAVVLGMRKMVQRAIGGDIVLELDAPATPLDVLIDQAQLEQVVMNLAVNARDAIAGRGTLSMRVVADGSAVVLEVRDTGSGMPPAVLARIFEPYFTTKELGKGTGLGLATVRSIVDDAGGTIAVDSVLGRGTTFRIAIPRTSAQREETVAIPLVRARGTALVVDDDDTVRRLTERILRQAGYTVIAARTGSEALAVAATTRFDVVVTDLVMPAMSGRELARELATLQPHAPVLFVSGYNPGTPIPDERFLAKPFERHALLRKLARLGV